MRRATIVTLRTMIVLLLLAAALDVKLPGRSQDRVRVHLIDRSASVLVPGPDESIHPKDADEIVTRDVATKSSGDVVTWASFGRSPAFESKSVDPSGSDLAAALRAALGKNPTEIILYSDGRGDPGDATFLCRDRNVPVYVFPLGPTSVQDVRIVRIEAPPDAPPGSPVPIAVVVEATYPVKARVRVGPEARDVDLAPNVPTRLAFTLPKPDTFQIDLDVADACRENNRAVGQVLPRTEKRQILLLSAGSSALKDFEVQTLQRVPTNLWAFDAVVLDNVALPADDRQALAAWVKSGGALLLAGGPKSYGLADWRGSPLEEVSPLKCKPDLRVSAVFGLDASGSMNQDWPLEVDAVSEVRKEFDDDDDLIAMTFGDDAQVLPFDQLRKVTPTGGTSIGKGIREARRHLETRPAGRKAIVLITDGESKETPEEIQAEIALLKDIALVVVTTKKEVPGARNVPIKDWSGLRRALEEVRQGMEDLRRTNPGPVQFAVHPATSGIGAYSPAWINRTTAKVGAQVVATVGQAPAQDPVLAFGMAGRGRVAALTIELASSPARLLRQAIEQLAGDGDAGLTLSVDPPLVRARGRFPDATFETGGSVTVRMTQVASDAWEGRLPDGLSGTVVVSKGRAKAAATIPCPPEFAALGVDRAALERIARETGGRVLRSPEELAALPRPRNPAPLSGRTLLLIAALALVFAEMAVSTFWKV